jgi:hypothetical protein
MDTVVAEQAFGFNPPGATSADIGSAQWHEQQDMLHAAQVIKAAKDRAADPSRCLYVSILRLGNELFCSAHLTEQEAVACELDVMDDDEEGDEECCDDVAPSEMVEGALTGHPEEEMPDDRVVRPSSGEKDLGQARYAHVVLLNSTFKKRLAECEVQVRLLSSLGHLEDTTIMRFKGKSMAATPDGRADYIVPLTWTYSAAFLVNELMRALYENLVLRNGALSEAPAAPM